MKFKYWEAKHCVWRDAYLCANYKEKQRNNKVHSGGNGGLRVGEWDEVTRDTVHYGICGAFCFP